MFQLASDDHLGDVVDVGCGRGQFGTALLIAERASSVLGIDVQAALLEQARAANQQQGYSTRIQDLAADQTIPPADTVLLIDVLYQLDTLAQRNLLAESARSARRMIVIRTADPRAGFRSMITSALERLFRKVWPHSGAAVNALPPMGMQRQLEQHGFQCTITPCRAGTPFSNVLLIARRRG